MLDVHQHASLFTRRGQRPPAEERLQYWHPPRPPLCSTMGTGTGPLSLKPPPTSPALPLPGRRPVRCPCPCASRSPVQERGRVTPSRSPSTSARGCVLCVSGIRPCVSSLSCGGSWICFICAFHFSVPDIGTPARLTVPVRPECKHFRRSFPRARPWVRVSMSILLLHSPHKISQPPPLKKIRWRGPAGAAQWAGYCSANQKVAGSIPSQDTCLGCGFGPWSWCLREAASRCLSSFL